MRLPSQREGGRISPRCDKVGVTRMDQRQANGRRCEDEMFLTLERPSKCNWKHRTCCLRREKQIPTESVCEPAVTAIPSPLFISAVFPDRRGRASAAFGWRQRFGQPMRARCEGRASWQICEATAAASLPFYSASKLLAQAGNVANAKSQQPTVSRGGSTRLGRHFGFMPNLSFI